jgi:hypothetical protein
MSIPAPAGLSGGPLFRPGAPPMVTALVTENLQSTTFLDQIETIVELVSACLGRSGPPKHLWIR